MGKLRRTDPTKYTDAPLRAGLFTNVANDYLHPEGFLAIMRGDAAAAGKGRFIANLMGAPTVTESDTRNNPFEDVYGQSGDVVGNEQIEMVRAELTFSLISLTLENLKLIRPDYVFKNVFGADGAFATLAVGTGTAGVTYTADQKGTAGNSIRVAHVNPGAASPLSVAVSGNDITVTLAHSGTALTSTAAQVRDAVNAHAGAAPLVNAGLTGDGTGVAVAQALTNLAGGTNGTVVGVRLTRRANVAPADYLTNAVIVWSNSDKNIGGAYLLKKAINVNEDKEYSFDDDGNAFGVEVNLRAHSDGSSMDPITGDILPGFEEYKFGGNLTIPA